MNCISDNFEHKLAKTLQILPKVVIVDGLIGGGKGMLSPIIESLPGVEMWIHRPELEQICALHHLGHISISGASTLIRHAADYDIYNMAISREVNMRPVDRNSMFRSNKFFRYVGRAFARDQSAALDKISSEKPILNIMTHAITPYSKSIFEAFGEKLVYVRLTRSPTTIYLLKHISRWTKSWEDMAPRSSLILHTVRTESGESPPIPFIVRGKECEYLGANEMDRAIQLLNEWQLEGDHVIDCMRESSEAQILEIPYEIFVINPHKYMRSIAECLGTTITHATLKAMKKQKVPRKSMTHAPEDAYYRHRGWVPATEMKSVAEEFDDAEDFAGKHASESGMNLLSDLRKKYEERHLASIDLTASTLDQADRFKSTMTSE